MNKQRNSFLEILIAIHPNRLKNIVQTYKVPKSWGYTKLGTYIDNILDFRSSFELQ